MENRAVARGRTTGAHVTLIVAALAGASCHSSPVAPASPLSPTAVTAPTAANFAGEWSIVYHVDSCIGRYCYISHINRDETLVVRLVQIGDRVTGLVGSADVEGVVTPDGSLSLRGFAAAAPVPLAASFELKQFEARLHAEHGLTGHLDFASLMSGDYSAYSYGATGPIMSASRRPLDTTSFNGSWRGYYTRTACAPAESCAFPEQDDATVTLEDSAGTVSGTVTLWPRRLEVTGRSSGKNAELRGHYQWSRDVTAEVVVRAERSSTGRLTGTVELLASNGLSRVFTLLSVVPDSTR